VNAFIVSFGNRFDKDSPMRGSIVFASVVGCVMSTQGVAAYRKEAAPGSKALRRAKKPGTSVPGRSLPGSAKLIAAHRATATVPAKPTSVLGADLRAVSQN
jgi:hypothetical protein